MSVKLKNYLGLKGISIEEWLQKNDINSLNGLSERLDQLGLVATLEDTQYITSLFKKAQKAQKIQKLELEKHDVLEETQIQRTSQRRKKE